MATLAATITNLVIGVHGEKNAKLKTVDDFMPKWDIVIGEESTEKKKRQSTAEMKRILMGIVKHQQIEYKKKNR